ncbi:MAG: nucleoside triphosphate pyrophosphohydrolase family protein [Candidatus Thiodiazotropha sp. (ex Ctena orbiculata)]|nr:nucleoside triphosphate pyrophosphohydrolase family protein [Candidatus Thiodiazotropha taylori]MBT2997409.1 nucleoside triphosphate pyrophosphohydrolase family protein [Candidatus Thiodiazotropha taylori]MBV2111930.1 nucleoside triphosphate pyrophosphohydrolase family protein [Candidatus Thiodiazotropha taylori]
MYVDEYQAEATETMQFKKTSDEALSIVMLGLNGEVGSLSTEYKKKIRDGDKHTLFKEKLIEELDDIIWYLTSIATIEDIPLSQILKYNLKKTKDRWADLHETAQLPLEGEFYDDEYDEQEQLPREFVTEFKESTDRNGKHCIKITVNGETFGNTIRDNNYEDDYYRYHDLFHFSYATCLGWSPTARGLMHKKRRSNEQVNEIEDGGRAIVIDEAISALVFEHARNHKFYEGVTTLDEQLLQTIRLLTRHLEVKQATPKEWEKAILTGFNIWRTMHKEKSGRVICNLHEKTMYFEKLQ